MVMFKIAERLFTLGGLTCGLSFSIAGGLNADENLAPRGLPAVTIPKDNLHSADKVELGKQLYFDKRLSADNTVSCATCHDPKLGWSNADKTAVGVGGQRGGRSAPTVLNSAYQQFQFWDGRAPSLEAQALGPIANPIEMNLPIEKAVEKIAAIKGYQEQFQKVFGQPVSADGIAKAIAAFERTILSGDAPYDHFKAGEATALSEQAQEGMKLFFGKFLDHLPATHATLFALVVL